MSMLLFFVGFILLLKGADILVMGATSIAARFRIPDIVVGLTIVSFGTSMPEASVSMLSNLGGHADLAIGNILGSNIANGLLVLGVAAIIYPLPVRNRTVLSEIPFSLTAALLVGFLANAALFSTTKELSISRLDGSFLLLFLILFLMYIFKTSKEGSDIQTSEETQTQLLSLPRTILCIFLGAAGLYIGGKWVVDGALEIVSRLGFSESLVALTVVAMGTSLPELTTSAVAAYRKNADIAVGNVVGSNIFNLLWVLGISAVIKELPFDLISNRDIVMVIFSSTLLIFALVLGRKGVVERWKGIIFVLFYFAYLFTVFQRG